MEESFMFSVGVKLGQHIARSERLKETNAPARWLVKGKVGKGRYSRFCENWAGARLAMHILERQGCADITYELVGE